MMRDDKEILREILKKRNITSEEEVSEFLSDKPQKTYDPFLLRNMEAGVDLLLSEINSGGRICIYGDYDADGVTSICVLSHVIRMLTDNFTYYVPSRFKEGYGLNKDALSKIKKDGTDLVVTVDCGSVACDEVKYAKELGMKIIVTDHHTIEDVQADCILINPKQKGCGYPFKELAGCGVAFKMAQAICRKTGLPRGTVNEVLDLAAVGTVGDIVSLTDENRTIVKYGLNKINAGSRKALKRLTEAISLETVTSEDIAFGIAPHINAAGRMKSAREAAELFLTEDDGVIDDKVKELVAFNNDRKKKQEEAYNKCMEMVSGRENFIVLNVPDIHEGISGIVAGKIKENLNRPVVIVTPSGDGRLKGTGRSIDTVNIYKVLSQQKELFISFGGHKGACGFTMKEENFDKLKAGISDHMEMMIKEDPDILEKKTYWDMEMTSGEATASLAKGLEKLEPFGQGSPRPVFKLSGVTLQDVRFMGEGDAHARFTASSDAENGVRCVLFRSAQDNKDVITAGRPTDMTGTVNLQMWKGWETVQFIVEEFL